MKRIILLFTLLISSFALYAQNEIEPEGGKLLLVLIVAVASFFVFFVFRKKNNGNKKKQNNFDFFPKKLKIDLNKDALYYPDNLKLKITNTRNTDVDLDRPLLVFDNFWLKRKFKLKGMENRTLYPLYLEKGKSHTLTIDLNRFYSHDKKLKKFPKAKVIVYDMKGKRLGSKSVFLRKTLVKF